ncbi:27 kDa hemolymph protein [Stomoxys calcitrans]|uniref:27 kDa hemolymph protein n=1 Tax=Stomoxys calcitrans TaxID=35570 RepID=UPI0027E23911|nr:27 kDa hemolymph protein [Stomoxys calcitrans]
MAKVCTILVLLTSCALIQNASAQNALELESELQGYLPSNRGQSKFSLQAAKDLLERKCSKVLLNSTASTQFEKFERAGHKFFECVSNIANATEVLEEVEAARPTGDLDLVIVKYCQRIPQAKKCLNEFNEQLLVCLTPSERIENANMMRIFTSLLDALCHKNGDSIALFIAEEGPECLEANKDNIVECMNATFAAYLPDEVPAELPELVIGSKQCIELHDFEQCVLNYLEKCKEVTPSGIVESVFRYLRRETICQVEIEKVTSKHQRNGAMLAPKLAWPMFAILAAILASQSSVKFLL